VVNTLIEQSKTRPLVLFLDSCEHAPDTLIAWIERRLILPLIKTERALCILASQTILRWRHFHVRRRVKPVELLPLDQTAVRQQIQLDDTAIVERICEITHGHPFAVQSILDAARKDGVVPITLAYLDQHWQRLARSVVNALFERSIATIDEELKKTFEAISLFREFDIYTLQSVLPKCLPEDFEDRTQSSFYSLLKRLIETRLVSWNNDRHAYQIDPTIRKIVAHAVYVYDPKHYAQCSRVARTYYEDLSKAARSNDRRRDFLHEYIFQLVQYADKYTLSTEQLQADLTALLKAIESQVSGGEPQQTDVGLEQMLQQDSEIHELLQHQERNGTIVTESLRTFQHL
jgi:hypothetical protein